MNEAGQSGSRGQNGWQLCGLLTPHGALTESFSGSYRGNINNINEHALRTLANSWAKMTRYYKTHHCLCKHEESC